MRRREFISLLGGAAAAWPFDARAQQAGVVRVVGVLMNLAADDRRGQAEIVAFQQAMQQLGWTDGHNMRLDIRWTAGDAERIRENVAELVALSPDVILAATSSIVAALQQTNTTVPIVFVGVIDPVGAGFVESLARPGGNATGFIVFEYAIAAKWLELLKEIAPQVTRAAVLRDPTFAAGIGQFAAIQSAGPMGVELSAIGMHDAAAIERDIAAFARNSNGGLVVTAGPFLTNHPDVIVALAAQHKLPTVYPFGYYVSAGGLVSYGPDPMSPFNSAAGYAHRILRGEKPADLPVQAPTKYQLAINLKAAKALGLTISPSLLARADEVIE
jgi:putative ABC transport system substrate-binding protein